MYLNRFAAAILVTIAIGGCSATTPGEPAQQTPGPTATARPGVTYFKGVVDSARRTVTFMSPSPSPGGITPDTVTVGYGAGTDLVYLHTISASYDDGDATGTHACGSPAHVIRLCASVAVVNQYAAPLNEASAVIDTVVGTGVTVDGPYVYGTVAANSTSSPLTWTFTLPSSALFTFTGHVAGDVPWLSTGAMAHARLNHRATLLGSGQVLVSGGYSSVEAKIVAQSEIYDPTTGLWTATTGVLNTPRFAHAASLLASGKVLISGGVDGFGHEVLSCEIFDPATGLWTTTGSLNTARSNQTQTTLPSGKVLVAGGQTGESPLTHLASSELFDPTTNSWTLTTSAMAHPRTVHTATLLKTGKVLVAGGATGTGAAVCELFNPTSGTWSTTGSLSSQLTDHAATLLPSGNVLVTGGLSTTTFVADIQLYDATMGTFTSLGALNTPRSLHTATLTATGKVLVAGGYDGSGASSSAEECDPVAGTCSTTGSLGTAREQAEGVQLTTGKTLEVGGYDTGTNSIAASEIYDN